MDECFGKSVHHCPYCDGWEHRDQQLGAVGRSAAAAATLALSLKTWSQQVTAFTQGDALDHAERERLQQNGIGVMDESITRLVHENGALRGVELATGQVVAADALFFNTLQRQHSDLAAQLGLKADDENRFSAGQKQSTAIPGLFLAGDIDGDIQFAIVAAAEGATAAVAINTELQEEERGG
jgi:thioredoxin reductase